VKTRNRWLLAIPFVALGIALAFLFYTLVPKEANGPTADAKPLATYLPADALTTGGGIFYTDYRLLRQTITTTTATNGALLEFIQKASPFDLSSSLFQLFNYPDLAQEVKLDWQQLQESAWIPWIPLEIVRGSFDWTTFKTTLKNEGYAEETSGQALLYNAPYFESNRFAYLGQLAIQGDVLVIEHYSPPLEATLTRTDILKAFNGTATTVAQTPAWAAFTSSLQGVPSFYLGPAPAAPGAEALVALDPTTTATNFLEKSRERAKYFLSPSFLDFAAFPDMAEKGKVTFLLRYQDEKSAAADKNIIANGMSTSYSLVFPGETFLSLLGTPQVTQEGSFLRVVTHSQNGIKILQAFVQNRDFGFLYQEVAE
jgi:hypothetical protein